MMRTARLMLAVLVAMVSLMFVLQQAAAEPRHSSESVAGEHRVYLSLVTAASGSTSRASTSAPNSGISVTAHAGLSCEGGETVPVSGARITVVTDHSSRVATTDQTGYALFSATAEPAVIQIEWPVGFLPCPNSRPIVELPAGSGEVKFIALAGR